MCQNNCAGLTVNIERYNCLYEKSFQVCVRTYHTNFFVEGIFHMTVLYVFMVFFVKKSSVRKTGFGVVRKPPHEVI